MENLRRVIIPWTDNGYNFNFKTSDTIHTYVVIITNVVKNSPAEAAGLRVGDGIVSINGNLLRSLTKSEIHSLINNFRDTALKLTVLQNFNNSESKDKKVDGFSYSKDQFSRDIPKGTIPYKFRGLLPPGPTDTEKSTKRKFSKYSRNMSDVTQNSRFYYNPVLKEDLNRRSSSPLKNIEINRPIALGISNSESPPNQLQLNRVGGILRKPLPSNAVVNNLFIAKPDKPDMRRKNKLTYLTCSPIPYRSGRIVDSSVIQERRSLPEQSIRQNIYEQMSVDNPEVIKEIVEEKLVNKEESPSESQIIKDNRLGDSSKQISEDKPPPETIKHSVNIDPVTVRIMWKFTNDSETLNPTWQLCTISVENGMLRVKENEETETNSSGIDKDVQFEPDETGKAVDRVHQDDKCCENSKYIYNFSYFDSSKRKWEFLVEFADQNASVRWMHFFDSPKPKESRKNSKTLQSYILNPTNTNPMTEIIHATTAKIESTCNKGKLHHALNRVRNFTQRRLNNDPSSDFKKQQEEWLMKTEPHFITVSENEESKEMAVNICTDHLGYLGDKVQIPHLATLPLDKWQRSVTSPLIPLVVEICVKVIEQFGMHYVGIYRVSGNKLSLDAINGELRRPLNEIDLSSEVWNDIYAISGVLKSFLRNLPDGVFPKDYYFEIISAWKMYEKDREKRLLSVQRLLNILDSVPDHPEYRYHRETLRYLASHLYLISSKNSINKMTSKNLAVVFAPTLIRPPTETNEILMSDYRYRIELVESIINHHEWMFSPSFESACNIPSEVDQENSMLSEMQFESFTEEQIEEGKIIENKEDARVLIKEIIENVKTVSPNSPKNDSDNTQYTLIELNTSKETKDKHDEVSTKQINEKNRSTEEYLIDTSPEVSETMSTKEKKSSKRMSFKLSKLKHGKSNFPRDQLLLTNKKICALSIALITSNRHPLNSALILDESPKITVE